MRTQLPFAVRTLPRLHFPTQQKREKESFLFLLRRRHQKKFGKLISPAAKIVGLSPGNWPPAATIDTASRRAGRDGLYEVQHEIR